MKRWPKPRPPTVCPLSRVAALADLSDLESQVLAAGELAEQSRPRLEEKAGDVRELSSILRRMPSCRRMDEKTGIQAKARVGPTRLAIPR
jgi:hypothetical protein